MNVLYPLHVCELFERKKGMWFHVCLWDLYLHLLLNGIQSDFCHFNVIIFTDCYRETKVEKNKQQQQQPGLEFERQTRAPHIVVGEWNRERQRQREAARECVVKTFFNYFCWEYFELVVVVYKVWCGSVRYTYKMNHLLWLQMSERVAVADVDYYFHIVFG